ncbi:MAG TPA: Ig-like domain-containing protein, partial [Pyrinomonadaceae bacterium]
MQPANAGTGGGGGLNEALGALPVAAPLAPGVTATKTDSFPDPDGDNKAAPGQTITYTVQITNNGADAATGVTFTDLIGANIALVPGSVDATPVAIDDAYAAVGNVRISVPDGAGDLLSNDCNPDAGVCNGTGLTASGPATSANGGNVTINANGSFDYIPPPGFTGADTFNYTVTDGVSPTDEGTVTVNVAGMIWFVQSGAAAGGDGRLTSPFNCYTGTSAPGVQTCFSDTAADEDGDNIFLYSGNYTGGNTLLNNQRLIGQGATATLASITGVTVPTHSDALPSTGGAGPALTTTAAATNAVTLGQGNTLRGFNVGNTTGAKIFGSGFGTLTVGNTTPDVSLSGSGQALSLTNGTFAATSAFGAVATTSSGAQGILLSQVAGTVGFGSTSVSGATTQGISVGSGTANINFGNTSVTGGTDAIRLEGNTAGTRTFGTITTSGNSGAGFLHNLGGGAVSVTGATSITNPGGVGISVNDSNASLSFAATTVNKGASAGTGVSLTNNTSDTIGFTTLAVTTSNGTGLVATGGGTINTGGGSIVAAGGPSVDLGGVILGLNFGSLASTGSATVGLSLNAVAGALTSVATSSTNPNGIGIQVLSASGGPYNFGNTASNSSGGAGVSLGSNSAAVTFADLDIAPDSGQAAFVAANNTGTLTTTSGSIDATNSVALDITGQSAAARTPLSLALTLLESTDSASASGGLNLNFVSGNLTVSNPAGIETNIQNPTGVGLRVRNTGAGTLNFGDTNVSGSGGTGVVLGTAGAAPDGGNTGAVTFADLDIAPDSGQRALHSQASTGQLNVSSGTITTANGAAGG